MSLNINMRVEKLDDENYLLLARLENDVNKEQSSVKVIEIEKRANIDIVVLVDVSFSMTEQGKLLLTQEAICLLLDELQDNDRFQLMMFEKGTKTIYNLNYMTKEHKMEAKQSIRSLKAVGGLSNFTGGLLDSISYMRNNSQTLKSDVNNINRMSSLLVFTDGNMNHGIVHVPLMMKRLQTALTGNTENDVAELDYSLVFFGIGKDCDVELLERIASCGNLHLINKYSQIHTVMKPLVGNIANIRYKHMEMIFDASASNTNVQVRHVEVSGNVLSRTYFPTFTCQCGDNSPSPSSISCTLPFEDVLEHEKKEILLLLNVKQQSNELPIYIRVNYYDAEFCENYCLEATLDLRYLINEKKDATDLDMTRYIERVKIFRKIYAANLLTGKGMFDEAVKTLLECENPLIDTYSIQLKEDIYSCIEHLQDLKNGIDHPICLAHMLESSAMMYLFRKTKKEETGFVNLGNEPIY